MTHFNGDIGSTDVWRHGHFKTASRLTFKYDVNTLTFEVLAKVSELTFEDSDLRSVRMKIEAEVEEAKQKMLGKKVVTSMSLFNSIINGC